MKPVSRKCRRIAFACNDHRNGMFAGRFESVNISNGDLHIELEGPWTGMRFLADGRVRVGRRIYEHRGVSEWVGNWCWNEVLIVDPVRLLRHLKEIGFRCVCGPTLFYERFNSTPTGAKS